MVCTGAKTEQAARLASRKYVRVLQRFNVPVSFCDFEIQNIVASAYLGRTMRLMELSQQFGPYVSYEPDLFPGLVFRTTNPKLVFLIFRSGKVVITGAKNRADIDSTFGRLYHNVLKNFFDVEVVDAQLVGIPFSNASHVKNACTYAATARGSIFLTAVASNFPGGNHTAVCGVSGLRPPRHLLLQRVLLETVPGGIQSSRGRRISTVIAPPIMPPVQRLMSILSCSS